MKAANLRTEMPADAHSDIPANEVMPAGYGTKAAAGGIITADEVKPACTEAMLAAAVEFARRAHTGQTDKAGKPYISHPLRVMANVSTTEEKITAVLHDILEDTPYTARELHDLLGLPDSVINALKLLTRQPGEDYMAYVRQLSVCPLAAAVKRADLKDNMDLSRLTQITPKDLKRCEKYGSALKLLT